MIQAMGGLMSVTGERDDKPGGGPQKVGVPIVDLMTGMYAAVAVLAALARREGPARANTSTSACSTSVASFLANQAMNYLVSGKVPRRAGNAHPNIQPQDVFACRDGQIVLAVGNDGQFAKLCEVLGRPELAQDERFATNASRVRNLAVLHPLIAAIPGRTASALGGGARRRRRALRADQHGPGGVRGPAGEAPRHAGRRPASAGGRGAAGGIADAVHQHAPLMHDRAPPLLGEHTDEILRELGWPRTTAATGIDDPGCQFARTRDHLRHPEGDTRCRAFPLSRPDEMTPSSAACYDAVVAGPRGELRGPLRAALHRPELADKWQQLGERCASAPRCRRSLKELAILRHRRHGAPSSNGTSTSRWRSRPACRRR